MTYECFAEKNFRPDTLATIEKVNRVVAEYQAAGYVLTLRQLHYQFVSRDWYENTFRNYKRLGSVVTDGRMAGVISWDAIEDRGRETRQWRINEDVYRIVSSLPNEYCVDMWANQERHVEVWVEKEALVDVIRKACMDYAVPFMACKGYLSASTAYEAGQRLHAARESHDGAMPLIIHLGDHDPSGIDMSRDNRDRTTLFSYDDVEVRRIALNRDQVDLYGPPPNFAKMTDSRADEYVAIHGTDSWELDALDPATLHQLIQEEIQMEIDPDVWADDEERQRDMRQHLRKIGDNWEQVSDFLEGL